MTSIKDIAKELNIAVSTVSMALNDHPRISDKTKQLVNEKAREMKYVRNGAAVDLRKKKTNLILLVVYDASRAFFSRVIKELQIGTADLGYDFLISTTYGGHQDTALRYIREKRSDAVIIFTKTIDDQILDAYASADFPVFVLGHKADTGNPHIRSFFYMETLPLETCEYLIQKGHRRIGFVTGFSESYGTIRSLNGFRLSMKNHSLPVDESLIFDAEGSQFNDGYRVTEEKILARLDDMDGIIFSNDDVAIGAMKCFNDHHIAIPERLSVIGRHNIPASSSTSPPLTTSSIISGDPDAYKKLVKCLHSYIQGKPDHKLEKSLNGARLETIIVERDTVRDLTNA